MKLLPIIAASLLCPFLPAAELETARPTTLTFFVDGIECGACVEVVKQSVEYVKGVTAVQMEQRLDSVANVTFDAARVKPHEISLAVRDAVRLHGLPYEASLRLRIPACIQPANRAGIEKRLANVSPHLAFRLVDPDLGEYAADLKVPGDDQPLPKDWWSLARLEQALRAPAPDGLGLTFDWVMEQI